MSLRMHLHIPRGDFALEVDLDLPSRGVTAVFGPSGAGKTTLLRAVAGLESAPAGLVQVNTEVWQKDGLFVPPHKRRVGYVFQEPRLFPHLSVRGNLEFARKRALNMRSENYEKSVELLGLGPLLERRIHQISGGERQRVAIARALCAEPQILLLDEPLVGIDHERKQEIMSYLERLHDEWDLPILYVTHALDEVMTLADTLVCLDRGRVTAVGPLQECLTRSDLPLIHGDDAGSVVDAEVTGYDPDYDLTHLVFAGNSLVVSGQISGEAPKKRLRIQARDVSLTRERPTATSILNVFPGVVDDIVEENRAQVTVRLRVGDARLLSRITKKSAEVLDLGSGQPIFVQVKSVCLLA